MGRPTHNWGTAVARRIGLGGSINFTQAAVGQTLHIPCAKGDHVVDVTIGPHEHPDGIAKKMLRDGWTIGSKPCCPDHNRTKRKGKSIAAILGAMPPEKRSELAKSASAKRWEGVAPDERSRQMKVISGIRYSKETPTVATKPPISDDAKKAHRQLILGLEDWYDDATKAYRPGWDDKRVAQEIGVSAAYVATVREEYYGAASIPRPPEFDKLVEDVAATRKAADDQHREAIAACDALSQRIRQLCIKNGWAVT